MAYLTIINVVVDKSRKTESYDVFESAWKALIQRFENTLLHRNFAGPANPDERRMIFPDHTDDKKLQNLLRQMRRYNPIPNMSSNTPGYRNLALTSIVEYPSFRDSLHSYFIQAVDCAAFLLYQHLTPNSYLKKKSGKNYFFRLEPRLCTVASTNDPMGLVRL